MIHPLISTLPKAGTLAATVARNLRPQNYGGYELRFNMHSLADALVTDATGHDLIHDRCTLDDRDRSKADRDAARARNGQRTAISTLLTDLPRTWRVQVIDALATGQGRDIATRLQEAADQGGELLIAALRTVADQSAYDAPASA